MMKEIDLIQAGTEIARAARWNARLGALRNASEWCWDYALEAFRANRDEEAKALREMAERLLNKMYEEDESLNFVPEQCADYAWKQLYAAKARLVDIASGGASVVDYEADLSAQADSPSLNPPNGANTESR